MASLMRKPVLLVTILAALAAAAPQRGNDRGRGRWQSRPDWQQQQQQQQPQPTIIESNSGATVTSPPSNQANLGTNTINQPLNTFQTQNANPTLQPNNAQTILPDEDPSNQLNTNPTLGGGSSQTGTGITPSNTAVIPSGGGSENSGGKCDSDPNGCRPGGKKAGVAGADAVGLLGDSISWYYDWSPNPNAGGSATGVPMLWGDGHVDATDAQRNSDFNNISPPDFLLGFNEPDCTGNGNSADLTPEVAAPVWNEQFVSKIGANTKVGSPSPCDQAGTWLDEFKDQGLTADWDITTIHIYKNDVGAAEEVINHYSSLGKPIWVTEWACVDTTSDFDACTDQNQISEFIGAMVDMMEAKDIVRGYSAISAGYGLGDTWGFVSGGQLTTSGQAYLSAISKY